MGRGTTSGIVRRSGDLHMKSALRGFDSDHKRGMGVKNPENIADVICTWSLAT